MIKAGADRQDLAGHCEPTPYAHRTKSNGKLQATSRRIMMKQACLYHTESDCPHAVRFASRSLASYQHANLPYDYHKWHDRPGHPRPTGQCSARGSGRPALPQPCRRCRNSNRMSTGESGGRALVLVRAPRTGRFLASVKATPLSPLFSQATGEKQFAGSGPSRRPYGATFHVSDRVSQCRPTRLCNAPRSGIVIIILLASESPSRNKLHCWSQRLEFVWFFFACYLVILGTQDTISCLSIFAAVW